MKERIISYTDPTKEIKKEKDRKREQRNRDKTQKKLILKEVYKWKTI